MDEFQLEAVSVLKLTKIRIGHDGKGVGAGWFLDKVVVKQAGDEKYSQEFGCQRYGRDFEIFLFYINCEKNLKSLIRKSLLVITSLVNVILMPLIWIVREGLS